MIKVKQIDLSSKKDKKKFFKFAIDLYKDNPHAAPNLYMDEMPEFDPEKNDAFRFCKCKMFLAYKDGKIAGRIAGIWHQGTHMKGKEGQLRFTRLDMIDDFEVTKALFEELKKWGRELGTNEIIGPMSFSDLNEEGMLIDGFENDSTYIEIYNYPYYVTHMEQLGAYKVVDWNCQRLRIPDTIDERLNRIADQVAEKNGYEMIDVAYLLKNDKPKLDDYIMECLDILDEAYAGLYGVSPIDEKQKRREMASIYQVLIPEFGALVAKDGKLVAYGFVMPSMLKAMHKGRGHIIPRGFAEYLKTMKHPEVADMMSIGIRHEHKNTGCAAMVVRHIHQGLIAHNVHEVETGPQLEYNRNVQNLWKNYEVISTKLRRCWGVKIDS